MVSQLSQPWPAALTDREDCDSSITPQIPVSSPYGDEYGARAAADLDSAVALFHSPSDPTRLAIATRLARGGEARVADLMAELGLAQSTVSAHMACLRECGLVTGRPQAGRCSTARPGRN